MLSKLPVASGTVAAAVAAGLLAGTAYNVLSILLVVSSAVVGAASGVLARLSTPTLAPGTAADPIALSAGLADWVLSAPAAESIAPFVPATGCIAGPAPFVEAAAEPIVETALDGAISTLVFEAAAARSATSLCTPTFGPFMVNPVVLACNVAG